DWLELYNSNEFAVDIGGFYLTDSLGDPTKYRIPSHSPELTTIEPKGFYVVYADNTSDQGVHHTNFKLKRDGEQIILSHYTGTSILDSVTYSKQFRNSAYGRIRESGERYFIPPTPGTTNVVPDFADLVINVAIADNKTVFSDEFDEFDDWIELFNRGEYPLDVGGLYVTDSLADPTGYRIPTVRPDSTTIQPGDYLVLWADNDEEQGVLHLGFKISKLGEPIGISDYRGELIDSVTIPPITPNQSWGRTSDGEVSWTLFAQPTPMMSNSTVFTGMKFPGMDEIRVYPNPVADHLFIDMGNLSDETARFQLVDVGGKVVLNGLVPSGFQYYEINMEHLQRGIYFLSWYYSTELYGSFKIIKAE
ncbi:MAG: lamin tail domain-containing protein, partial [Bacteroidales bacterium]|nr:lamin tail domain-containing protein [Bacteroidales bacterium]